MYLYCLYLFISHQDDNYGVTHFQHLSGTKKYMSMMSVMNIDANKLLISSKTGGIYSIKGDAFVHKDVVLSWMSPDLDALELKHFMAAILLSPKISLIIVGTGNKMERLPPKTIAALQNLGIGVEFCSSLKACSLYNLLLTERDGEGVALFVKGTCQTFPIFFFVITFTGALC